jgi:hypothetical protein
MIGWGFVNNVRTQTFENQSLPQPKSRVVLDLDTATRNCGYPDGLMRLVLTHFSHGRQTPNHSPQPKLFYFDYLFRK